MSKTKTTKKTKTAKKTKTSKRHFLPKKFGAAAVKPAKKAPVKKALAPMPQAPTRSQGAIVGGTDPCVCGGAPEDHGRDPEYPGSTACTHCTDCVAYEADPEALEAEGSV